MNCLEDKEFVTYELKPLIKDCISYWIKDEYECEISDDISNYDIEELSNMDIPEELSDTIYDAVVNLIKEDNEYDTHISRDELTKYIYTIWIDARDNYVDYLYEKTEKSDYINDDY